jgi:DNA-binding transcriptional LysR family regulator
MNARRLGCSRAVVASPGYLQRRGVPRTPAELMQHTLLHYRFPSTGKLEPWPIHWPDDEAPQELPVHMVANTIEARVALALRDVGLAFVPVHSVRDALADGRLVTVLDGSCAFLRHLPPAVAFGPTRTAEAAGVHRLRRRPPGYRAVDPRHAWCLRSAEHGSAYRHAPFSQSRYTGPSFLQRLATNAPLMPPSSHQTA